MDLGKCIKEHFEKRHPIGCVSLVAYFAIGASFVMWHILWPPMNIFTLFLAVFITILMIWSMRYRYGNVAKRMCKSYLRKHKGETVEDLEADFLYAEKFGEKENVCFVGKKYIFYMKLQRVKIWKAEEIAGLYVKGNLVQLYDVKQKEYTIITDSPKQYCIVECVKNNMPHVVTEPERIEWMKEHYGSGQRKYDVLLESAGRFLFVSILVLIPLFLGLGSGIGTGVLERCYNDVKTVLLLGPEAAYATSILKYHYSQEELNHVVTLDILGKLIFLIPALFFAFSYGIKEMKSGFQKVFGNKEEEKIQLYQGNILERIFEFMKMISWIIIFLLVLRIGDTRIWAYLLFGMGAAVYLAGFLFPERLLICQSKDSKEKDESDFIARILEVDEQYHLFAAVKLLVINGAALCFIYNEFYEIKEYLSLLVPAVIFSTIIMIIRKRGFIKKEWLVWFMAVYVFCMGGVRCMNHMQVNTVAVKEKVVKDLGKESAGKGYHYYAECTDGSKWSIGQYQYETMKKGDCIRCVIYEGLLKMTWMEDDIEKK